MNTLEHEDNQPSPEDRRQYPRLPLRAYAQMQYSSKGWEAHLLDISASGIKLGLLSEHLLRKGDALRVHIMLDDFPAFTHSGKKSLHLHGRLAHVRDHILGLEFQPDTPADKNLLDELLTQLSAQESR